MKELLDLVPSLRETGQAEAYGLVWRYVAAEKALYAMIDDVTIIVRPHLRSGIWTYAAAGGWPLRRRSGAAPSLRHALIDICGTFPAVRPHLRRVWSVPMWVGGRGYVVVPEEELPAWEEVNDDRRHPATA